LLSPSTLAHSISGRKRWAAPLSSVRRYTGSPFSRYEAESSDALLGGLPRTLLGGISAVFTHRVTSPGNESLVCATLLA
jgi:hypothetical protein